MADDILTRLRIAGFDDSHPGDLLFQAADEIERLHAAEQGRIANLRMLNEANAELSRLRAERDEARAESSMKGYRLDAALDEIERLRAVVADRDEWNDRLAGDVSDLLMAIPKPFRKWLYLRSQRVREARRG